MEDFWLSQLSIPEEHLRDKLESDGDRRDLLFSEAVKAIVARIDALSAQVAEVRAAVGLPVEELRADAGPQGPATPGWNS